MTKEEREMFRKAGAQGGKKRAANMTPEARKASAVKASNAASKARKKKAKKG